MGTRMLLLCCCAALAASCTTTSPDGGSSIPDEARTTTTVAATSTTTVAPGTSVPQSSDAVPSWFRFGDDGLRFVADGVESLLVPDPVSWAAADYLGGVVFRYGSTVDRPGVYRLTAGSTDPELVSSDVVLPTRFDDRASIVTIAVGTTDEDYALDRVEVVDLLSGERMAAMGSLGYVGQDGGVTPSSAGGRLIAGVEWLASGSCRTDTAVALWSIDEGGAIDSPPSPISSTCDETCEPAGFGARLSPDGSLLAVLHAPVAKWPCPDLEDIGDEEWMASVVGTPVALSVLDLATGAEVWSESTPFPATLADFDGRYMVLHGSTPTSVIVDTESDREPFEIDGWIVLDRDPELAG